MQEFLTGILENSSLPILTALILGLMTTPLYVGYYALVEKVIRALRNFG